MTDTRRKLSGGAVVRIVLAVASLVLWRQICVASGDAYLKAEVARMDAEGSAVVPRVHFGEVVPDIPLLKTNGVATSLWREVEGPTVVVFVSADCEPCESELIAQARSYQAVRTDARVIAIVLGRSFFGSPAGYAARISRRLHLQFPVFSDPDRLSGTRILPRPLRMPEVMLFNAGDRLEWAQAGSNDTDGTDWARYASLFAASASERRQSVPLADVSATDSARRRLSISALSFKHPVLITLASGAGKCGACDARLNALAYFAQGKQLTKLVAYSNPADANRWAATRSRDETSISIDPFASPSWCRPSGVPYSRLVWRGKVLLDGPAGSDNGRFGRARYPVSGTTR